MEGIKKDTWQDTYDDRYDEIICPKCNAVTVYPKNTTGHAIIVQCNKCGQGVSVESDPNFTPQA